MSNEQDATSIRVLDHGWVRLVRHWGSDEGIIEAARQSTGRGFLGWGPKGWECPRTGCGWSTTDEPPEKCPLCGNYGLRTIPGDEKLLRFLWSNKHTSPFEMAGAVFEVQAPIFVFREWHRHRTQSYAEMSARYTPLPDVNFVPSEQRLMANVGTGNKQAGTVPGALEMTSENAVRYRKMLAEHYERDQDLYELALKIGVPKEIARVHLPVGRYSRMHAQALLLNWTKFLSLRMAKGAQLEIREYANAVCNLLHDVFPRTMELFDETF